MIFTWCLEGPLFGYLVLSAPPWEPEPSLNSLSSNRDYHPTYWWITPITGEVLTVLPTAHNVRPRRPSTLSDTLSLCRLKPQTQCNVAASRVNQNLLFIWQQYWRPTLVLKERGRSTVLPSFVIRMCCPTDPNMQDPPSFDVHLWTWELLSGKTSPFWRELTKQSTGVANLSMWRGANM